MKFFNFLYDFFDFLLSSMAVYIGSFFSVIILSFFLKLILYKNQIDNLNNAIKREILYDDINNLFKRFNNTRNETIKITQCFKTVFNFIIVLIILLFRNGRIIFDFLFFKYLM